MHPHSKSRNYVLHTLEKVAPSAYESCIYELVDNHVRLLIVIACQLYITVLFCRTCSWRGHSALPRLQLIVSNYPEL